MTCEALEPSIGDLVSVIYLKPKVGIIIDILDLEDGFSMYEVIVNGEPVWLKDLEIEVLEKRNVKL